MGTASYRARDRLGSCVGPSRFDRVWVRLALIVCGSVSERCEVVRERHDGRHMMSKFASTKFNERHARQELSTEAQIGRRIQVLCRKFLARYKPDQAAKFSTRYVPGVDLGQA